MIFQVICFGWVLRFFEVMVNFHQLQHQHYSSSHYCSIYPTWSPCSTGSCAPLPCRPKTQMLGYFSEIHYFSSKLLTYFQVSLIYYATLSVRFLECNGGQSEVFGAVRQRGIQIILAASSFTNLHYCMPCFLCLHRATATQAHHQHWSSATAARTYFDCSHWTRVKCPIVKYLKLNLGLEFGSIAAGGKGCETDLPTASTFSISTISNYQKVLASYRWVSC